MKALVLLDEEGRQLRTVEKLLYALVLLFFSSLFLPLMPVVTNIILGFIVIVSFRFNSLKEKFQLLKAQPYMLLFLLYYLLHLLSFFWSNDKSEATTQLSMRLPILIFPLTIGSLVINSVLKDRIIYAIAIVTTAAALISLGLSFSQYRTTGNSGYLYNDSLTIHFVLQSIYVAMLVNISIVGLIYLLSKRPSFIKIPGLLYLAIFVLFGYHFLLASRSAMIILYGGIFLFAVYYIIKKRKYLEGTTLILGMFIGSFILFKFFPKTVQRFKELTYTNYQYGSTAAESHYDMKLSEEQWNGANTRLALWSCGWEVAKKNLITGVGIGDRIQAVNEVYKARNFTMAIQTKKNVHNSYLDALLTFGVGGLFLFMLTFVVLPLIDVSKRKDMFDLFVVTAFIISMIFEVYLARSIGSMLAGFFFSLIAATKRNT
ncbi:O-antigen ligase family protein [Lacibacter sp. H375]|uniref:O-antigen ligase family protein n=1 Tax=Lacibacter sp. H375 TaxID=3133424 RepID=UPI0030C00BD2